MVDSAVDSPSVPLGAGGISSVATRPRPCPRPDFTSRPDMNTVADNTPWQRTPSGVSAAGRPRWTGDANPVSWAVKRNILIFPLTMDGRRHDFVSSLFSLLSPLSLPSEPAAELGGNQSAWIAL